MLDARQLVTTLRAVEQLLEDPRAVDRLRVLALVRQLLADLKAEEVPSAH